MATWLFKTEPSEYSFAELEKAKRAIWDGVANPVAQKHLRSAAKGDAVIVYHTGKERAAVGLAEVASSRPDPKNEKLTLVELVARERLARPVSLDEIKATPIFADSPLVTIGRLSIVPLTVPQWKALLALAKRKSPA
jgi:predicted RNA-binding protein with PUA-like domain